MVVFNNRRMLHGRHGFRQRGVARRHLRGCYVNIDEFANRYHPNPHPNPNPNPHPAPVRRRSYLPLSAHPHSSQVTLTPTLTLTPTPTPTLTRYNLLRRRFAPPLPPGDALTPLARLRIGNQDWGGESVDAFAH